MKMTSQTLTRLIHQINLNLKREIVISGTVLAGVIVNWFLFRNNNELSILIGQAISNKPDSVYLTHLTINFLKSFLMVGICTSALLFTFSYRLVGLILFLVCSMVMDLGSIESVSFYHEIKQFRYGNNYNFKDTYFYYEIACLIFSGFYAGYVLFRSRFIGRDGIHDSHSV